MAKKSSNSSRKANAPRPLRKRIGKSAQASFLTLIAASTTLAAAYAIPIPPTPHPHAPGAAPTASASPYAANTLPAGSMLAFVLDGTISSSGSKAGDIVKAHLERPLVVSGVTVAPAGTPLEIKVTAASPASNPDIYGFVDIYLRPFALPDGRDVPVHAPVSHLDVHVTSGHQSTADVEDTVGDVFVPTLLLHAFRKGHNFVITPGTRIRAVTDATIVVASDGVVVVRTPAPLLLDADTPVSSFKSAPMATPKESFKPPLTPPTLGPGLPTP